jgi:hypothetical protein
MIVLHVFGYSLHTGVYACIVYKDYDQNSRSMLRKVERVVAPIHRSARDNPDIVEAKLDKEFHKGRIKGLQRGRTTFKKLA